MTVQTNSSVTSVSHDDFYHEHTVHLEHVLAIRHTLLSVHDAEKIAALFAVLSDPTRLQVVHALLTAPTGELCVCDIAAGLGRDDTTISHQLRVLRNQKIVAVRKVGRIAYYRLIDEHIRRLLEMGTVHACESDETLAPVSVGLQLAEV